MKILLISVNKESTPYPAAPLGLAYITKALLDKKHSVKLLDLCFVQSDKLAIKESIASFQPDLIGLSVRNIDNVSFLKNKFYLPRVKQLVGYINQLTKVPLVLGGAGFSLMPAEAMDYLQVDLGIAGGGEVPICQLIESLETGKPLSSVPNLYYRKEGKIVANSRQYYNESFVPDRSLLDNQVYFELGGMANLVTKRGCPFSCDYCSYHLVSGSKIVPVPPESIIAEFKELKELWGINHFFLTDDIFNHPADHAMAVCESIIREKLKIKWYCFATPKGFNLEMAKIMREAGCAGIEFGSDAGSLKTLRGHNKSFNQEDIKIATDACLETGLPVSHYLILGGPGENIDTLRETLTFINSTQPTAVIVFIGVRIYPKTGLYQRALQEGIISADQNLLRPAFYFSPQISVEELTNEVKNFTEKYVNWIVPDLKIGPESSVMDKLRERGRKGPLWNLLG